MSKKLYTLYKITNKINGKFYIGRHITSDINDDYYGSGPLIKRAITKYGKTNFIKETLFIFESKDEMIKKEIEIVNEEFISRSDTYNVSLGGNGSWSHIDSKGDNNPMRKSQTTRNKVSTGIKKTRALNREYYDNISRQNLKYAVEANTGKKRPDHSNFMTEFLTERWKDADYREKTRDSISNVYEITSPEGETFITNRLIDFCKEKGLSFNTIWNSSKSGKTPKKGRCVGWKCVLIKRNRGTK